MTTNTTESSAATLKWVFLTVALVLGVWYAHNQYVAAKQVAAVKKVEAAQKAAEYAASHPPRESVDEPIRQCTTPCSLYVGWAQRVKSDGQPVLIKFHGKTDWLSLSGRGNDKGTLDQFNPGEAQFVSPDRTPVRVQIFDAR
jgi:hypothetical protein